MRFFGWSASLTGACMLLILSAVPALDAQVTPSPTSVNFNSVAAGSPVTQIVSFTISGATLGGVSAVTQGEANADYTVVAAGTTCGAGTTSNCAVEIQFVPKAAGSRFGALVLSDGSGNTLSTVPLFGVGTGPVVGFSPGTMLTVIGGDVAGTTVGLSYPNGVAVDAAGNVYAASSYVSTVYKLTPGGVTTRIAGGNGGGYTGDGGPATSAKLNIPTTVRLDGAGNIYIVDDGNNVVRMINPAGIITTVAGLPTGGSICEAAIDEWGDGCPATQASLDFSDSYYGEGGTATDAAGNLYIGDTAHNLIRVVGPDGIISIFAGTGTQGYSGDEGPATSAQLNNPDGGVFDGAGNFYFADLYNNVIRKIALDGTISTVAGTGAYGHTGDGGLATSAQLGYPYQVAVDAAGNLYITDSGNFTEGDQNEVIREVTAATGIISTVAGVVPSSTYGGDGGPATSAHMWGPVNVVVDGLGNLYIADDYNHAIRKVDVTDAATLSFSAVSKGVSAAQDLNIVNLGNETLTISSIAASGKGFAVAGGTCATSNQSLTPGATCSTGADFTGATTLGTTTGSVVLTDDQLNVSNAKQSIPLSGLTIAYATTITWPTPASIVYGKSLSATQLDAKAYYNSASVSGTFVYTPPKGSVLGAGMQTLNVAFTPHNVLYSTASGSVTLQVTQATPVITWIRPAAITYPAPLTSTQLDASAAIGGTFVYNPPLGTVLNPGLNPLTVTFTPYDMTDYTTATKTVNLTVKQ